MRTLLDQFVSAIDAEIALLEKENRDQSYELLSGERDEKSTGGLYVFVLADALRLPEEASGTLKVDGRDISAMVYSQEGNRIWLLLESFELLPEYLPRATLVLNETQLLKRLKEKIEGLDDLGMAPKVFGKEGSRVGFTNAPLEIAARVDSEPAKAALRQCIGSEVTFLWGPPGTGKTFTIGALVAALTAVDETVLVTSHTHAAVEQALYALIEPPEAPRLAGFLNGSPLVDAGRVLKMGRQSTGRTKLPASVFLDTYVEERAKQRAMNIETLEAETRQLITKASGLRLDLAPWNVLEDAQGAHRRAADELQASRRALDNAMATVEASRTVMNQYESSLGRAERSFFVGRAGRVTRAQVALANARQNLTSSMAVAGDGEARSLRQRAILADAHARLIQADQKTEGLTPLADLQADLDDIEERVALLSAEVAALRDAIDEDAKALVENAAALFVTLTKLYMDRDLLPNLTWDTVIIDEVSMAMLPLIAFAASRANKRVILVGDMFQLPPVVRSEIGSPGELLTSDIFKYRQITEGIERGVQIPQLAQLKVQRRMHPAITEVAKQLIEAYRDLDNAQSQERPDFVGALGTDAPLVTVDVSNLNPWSGKMPGSLSRFNFLTGQAAVELASIYASAQSEPAEKTPPQIGIITPYAAQRRFLSRLVQSLSLERWVTAGTVHTFQGNECDVIIFDSVLGEPHWTARYTNPASFSQVKRDLNVAVTRARHQFVFVGDSRWLKKHAKPGSGYGKLWAALDKRAEHLVATDLLGEGFRTRVAKTVAEARGWSLERPKSSTLLRETEFYGAFAADLSSAASRVILYTPFIGKTRWPQVEPLISALRERGVEVYLLHKPLSDPEWRTGDVAFGRTVFDSLTAIGVRLIPMSGVHAKTIVIDGEIVYEGSLNWASQTSSYEHMWRFDSRDMAVLVEKMLQLKPLVEAYAVEGAGNHCPKCGGPLVLVNQTDKKISQFGQRDLQPMKLGCANYAEDKDSCEGYLRRVDGRPPFVKPPMCPRGTRMKLNYSAKTGRPWDWRCGHSTCKAIRWARGDCPG